MIDSMSYNQVTTMGGTPIHDVGHESKEEAEVMHQPGYRELSFPYLGSLKEEGPHCGNSHEPAFPYLGPLIEEEPQKVILQNQSRSRPTFPSYTSFREIEVEPDELDFLNSVPDKAEEPSPVYKPVFTPSIIKDRVQRLHTEKKQLQAEKQSKPTNPRSTMEISGNSNLSSSNHTESNLKQALNQRRRSSLASLLNSMQESLFGFVQKEESNPQPSNNSNTTTDSTREDSKKNMKENLKQRRKSSLTSAIETMHISLAKILNKEVSKSEHFATTTKKPSNLRKEKSEPLGTTIKTPSDYRKAISEETAARRERRQLLKDSLEYNSQAVSQILDVPPEPGLSRVQTEPIMNQSKMSKVKKKTMRRATSTSGALKSLRLSWGQDETLKRSPKQKQRPKFDIPKDRLKCAQERLKANSKAMKPVEAGSKDHTDEKDEEHQQDGVTLVCNRNSSTMARVSDITLDDSAFSRSKDFWLESPADELPKKSKKTKNAKKSDAAPKRLNETSLLRSQTDSSINLMKSPKIKMEALRRISSAKGSLVGSPQKKKKSLKAAMSQSKSDSPINLMKSPKIKMEVLRRISSARGSFVGTPKKKKKRSKAALLKSQTDSSMNLMKSPKTKREALRRISSEAGNLGSTPLKPSVDEEPKKSKKKKKKLRSDMSLKGSEDASPDLDMLRAVAPDLLRAQTRSEDSPPDPDMLQAVAPPDLLRAQTEPVTPLKSPKRKKKAIRRGSTSPLQEDSPPDPDMLRAVAPDLLRAQTEPSTPLKRAVAPPDLLRAQTEPVTPLKSPKRKKKAIRRGSTSPLQSPKAKMEALRRVSSASGSLGGLKNKKIEFKSDLVIPLKEEDDDNEDHLNKRSRSPSNSKKKKRAPSSDKRSRGRSPSRSKKKRSPSGKRSTKKDKMDKNDKKKTKKARSVSASKRTSRGRTQIEKPTESGKEPVENAAAQESFFSEMDFSVAEFPDPSTCLEPKCTPIQESDASTEEQEHPLQRKGRRRSLSPCRNPKHKYLSPSRGGGQQSPPPKSFQSRRASALQPSPPPTNDPFWQQVEFPAPSEVVTTEAFDPFSAPKPEKLGPSSRDTRRESIASLSSPEKDARKTMGANYFQDEQSLKSKETQDLLGGYASQQRRTSAVAKRRSSVSPPRSSVVCGTAGRRRRFSAATPGLNQSAHSADNGDSSALSKLVAGCTPREPKLPDRNETWGT